MYVILAKMVPVRQAVSSKMALLSMEAPTSEEGKKHKQSEIDGNIDGGLVLIEWVRKEGNGKEQQRLNCE